MENGYMHRCFKIFLIKYIYFICLAIFTYNIFSSIFYRMESFERNKCAKRLNVTWFS